MKFRFFDVSAAMWAGYTTGTFFPNCSYKGVPTGGPYFLLRQLRIAIRHNEVPILLWDSPTDRKKFVPSYKSGRSRNDKVEFGKAATWEFIGKSGVIPNSFKVDGFEADDLVYEFEHILSNPQHECVLYTSDYDWARYILSPNAYLQAVDTAKGVITVNNYSDMLYDPNIRVEVPYNAITPYKTFFKDDSDGIPLLKPHPDFRIDHLFTLFIKQTLDNGDKLHDLSSMIKFINQWESAFGKYFANELRRRALAIYPRAQSYLNNPSLTISTEPIKLGSFRNILSLFGCKKLCEEMGLNFIEDMKSMSVDLQSLWKQYNVHNQTHAFIDTKAETFKQCKPSTVNTSDYFRGGFVADRG